jgi:hypothetical protein
VFQVHTTKHTGAVLLWFNRRRTVTGSYAQCDAALAEAQAHNWALGWLSVGSLLWNPISLRSNANSRKALRQHAEQASAYSQWWATHYGAGDPHTRVWYPPPPTPARRRWWLWIPVGILVLIVALIVLFLAIGLIATIVDRATHSDAAAPQQFASTAVGYGANGEPFASPSD